MTAITVWKNDAGEVRLHQLTDDHDKIVSYNTVKSVMNTGTAEEPVFEDVQVPVYGPTPYAEQIDYLEMLEPFEGYTCVSTDYTGSAPEVDPSLWRWDGNKIIAITPVPKWVSAKQVRILLLRKGLLAQVKQMIAQQDEATQIEWEFSEKYERDNPLLLSLAANIPLDSAQIDQFFIEAAAIP